MRSLWIKDRIWLVLALGAGLSVMSAVLHADGFERTWVLPNPPSESVWIAALLLGFCLGAIAAVRDEVTRTQEYLWHRPLSRARILASTLMACGVVITSWLVAPPLIHWGVEAVIGEYAGIGSIGRVIDYALAFAVAPSAFAVALFAGTLRAPWLLRAITGGAALLAVLAFGNTLSVVGASNDAWLWVGFHAVATVAFVAAAIVNVGETADADRPWSMRTRCVSGTLVLLSWSACGVLGAAGAADEYSGEVRRLRPAVVETEGGEVRLAFEQSTHLGTVWLEADAEHRVLGDRLSSASPLFWRWSQRGGGDFGLDQPDFDRRSWAYGPRTVAVLSESTGLVDIGWRGHEWMMLERVERVGRAPDGARFSPRAQLLSAVSADTVWAVDDGALWRFGRETEPRMFERVALPGGDRFLDEQIVNTGDVAPLPWLGARGDDHVVAVIGEAGVYVVGDEIRPAPDDVRALVGESERFQVELVDDDLLAPRVRVVDGDSVEHFRHEYALRTLGERWWGGITFVMSTLRPPVLVIASYSTSAHSPPTFAQTPQLDPLVAGGRRVWLVVLCIATSAWLALGVHRRIARHGGARATARLHAVLTLALGPAAGLAAVLLESKRRYVAAEVAPAPAPWIESASPAAEAQ